jgi:hypothetical protein
MESDYIHLVDDVTMLAQDISKYLHLISEIKNLASQESLCFCKSGMIACWDSHCLAKCARAKCCTNLWLGSRPDVILQDLDHDCHVTQPE